MNLKNFPKRLDSKTSCLRISVPENLDLALEGLIRKVLREQPKTDDIYSFAADYFETLLRIRDKAGTKLTAAQLCPFHNDEDALEMIKMAGTFPKPPSKSPGKKKEQLEASRVKQKGRRKEAERKAQAKGGLKQVATPDLIKKLPKKHPSEDEREMKPKCEAEKENPEEEFLLSDPIKELVEQELMAKENRQEDKTDGREKTGDNREKKKSEECSLEEEKSDFLLQERENKEANDVGKTIEKVETKPTEESPADSGKGNDEKEKVMEQENNRTTTAETTRKDLPTRNSTEEVEETTVDVKTLEEAPAEKEEDKTTLNKDSEQREESQTTETRSENKKEGEDSQEVNEKKEATAQREETHETPRNTEEEANALERMSEIEGRQQPEDEKTGKDIGVTPEREEPELIEKETSSEVETDRSKIAEETNPENLLSGERKLEKEDKKILLRSIDQENEPENGSLTDARSDKTEDTVVVEPEQVQIAPLNEELLKGAGEETTKSPEAIEQETKVEEPNLISVVAPEQHESLPKIEPENAGANELPEETSNESRREQDTSDPMESRLNTPGTEQNLDSKANEPLETEDGEKESQERRREDAGGDETSSSVKQSSETQTSEERKEEPPPEESGDELCMVVDIQNIPKEKEESEPGIPEGTEPERENPQLTQKKEEKAESEVRGGGDADVETIQKGEASESEELCMVVDTLNLPKESKVGDEAAEAKAHSKEEPRVDVEETEEVREKPDEEIKPKREVETVEGKESEPEPESTTEADTQHIITVEEAEAPERAPKNEEFPIKTIQTHYYDTLQVPETVTKEYRIHSVAAPAAVSLLGAVASPLQSLNLEEIGEVATEAPPLAETDEPMETKPDEDLKADESDDLVTPTSGYSLNLSELSYQTVSGLFLDSERRFSSSEKEDTRYVATRGGDVRQEVEEEVFRKETVPSGVGAVPVPPREDEQINEEPTTQSPENEKIPEGESSEGSSNGRSEEGGDVPLISVEVKTVIETQVLDNDEEPDDQRPDVEVKIETKIDIQDIKGAPKPEVVQEKPETTIEKSQEKTDLKSSSEGFQSSSQNDDRKESCSTDQTTEKEVSLGESDSTSSAATEIKRTDSRNRNPSSTRSLPSTQSLDLGKRNPLVKTRSLSAFRHGVTDFEVWSRIEKELEDAATKIQSKYRGYKTRKKLQRENAVQITTEESSLRTTPTEAEAKDDRRQSTGEFHDSIILPEPPR